jgi:hypothetical protein
MSIFTQSLERLRLSEGNGTSETDFDGMYHLSSRPVGRARRRLHELLEDSFSLFGSRDIKIKESQQPPSIARATDTLAILSETRDKSAHIRCACFFLFLS